MVSGHKKHRQTRQELNEQRRLRRAKKALDTTASSRGFAALVAPGVRNSGTITATLGTVALASGNSFTLRVDRYELVRLVLHRDMRATMSYLAPFNRSHAFGWSVPRWWWGCASSARWRCWWDCSASSYARAHSAAHRAVA